MCQVRYTQKLVSEALRLSCPRSLTWQCFRRFVCGSDDFNLRVYNYNTSEKIISFEAHPDYIRFAKTSYGCDTLLNLHYRCLAVHPTQNLILTGSDDMTIKLWDWEKGWKCIQVGHLHLDISFLLMSGLIPTGLRGSYPLHHERCLQSERLKYLCFRLS